MRTWQAENFGAGTGERKETACRQKSGHERKRKPRAGRKAGTRAEGSRMQAEKRARERKEAACRQKSGHESGRKPHAGRKAGTREKGNRVQAEKRAREWKEAACRQKSRHERKSGRSKIVGISACLFYFCGGFISPYLPLYRKSASLELNADDFTLFWETICSASKTNLFPIPAAWTAVAPLRTKGNISLTIPSGLIWTAFPPVNKFLLLVPNTMNGMTPPSRLTM